jgi:L-lactate dehydrogenase complex protein LldG
VATFAHAVEEAGGVCHLVSGDIPEPLLDHLVSEFEAWDIVVSAEPEAQELAHRLAKRGAEVHSATPEHSARAAMGVTSASAGIAATGSVLLDSSYTGSRVVSALPQAHICVLPADRIVATPSDVLRPLGDQAADMPASLVLVSGPSRSGDIEQILTIGAHGPAAVHVIVLVGEEGKPSPCRAEGPAPLS